MDNRGRNPDRADPLRSLSQAFAGRSAQVLQRHMQDNISRPPVQDAGSRRTPDGKDGKHDQLLDLTWRCEYCNQPMPAKRKADSIYCSKTCSNAHYNGMEREARLEAKANRPPCQHCGKAIPAAAPANRIFCSIDCQRFARRVRDKAKQARDCEHCGKRYGPSIPDQKHCGRICAAAASRLAPKPCGLCETIIPAPMPRQLWCSTTCRDRASRYRIRAKRKAMG